MKDKIKVLQVGMSRKCGGIETYLINYQENIDKNKIQMDFINVFDIAKEQWFYNKIKENGNMYDLPNYRKHPIKFIRALKKLNDKEDYDVFHYNMASSVYLLPLIAAKLCGIKCIIAHAHNNSSDKGFFKEIVHWINKHFITLFANNYFACSNDAGKWFFSKKIIKSDKFKVIKNAIDTDKFKYNKIVRDKLRRELNIDDDTIVVGHVGNFKPVKNHSFVIDVFNEISKMNNNTKLVLVGQGVLLEEIKYKVEKLGLEENVIFVGEKSNVNDYMQVFDVLLFPSIYEGLGIVLVEAQASGLPCVTTLDIPSEAEVSDKFYRYSLSDSPTKWAKGTLDAVSDSNRDVSNECLSYDIKKCSRNLEKIYSDISKIKVCHFVYGIVNGGVERVLLNYFSNMDLEKYDFHIITQGDSDEKCIDEFTKLNFTIHTVTKKSKSIIKNYKDIMSILRKYKFDIVHCHMSNTNIFPLFYSWIAHIKIRINHSHTANSKQSLSNVIMRKTAKMFDTHRMACSQDAAMWLFDSSKNVKILNNAIELEHFEYDPEVRKKMRKELGINENIVIGHIGRFAEQKNHEFLIRVFNELYKENNNYKLLLIGIGELETKIKDQVSNLESKDNILFLGTRNDVNELYQAMDIFVLPSLFEGLGIVLVEAQVSGLECISSTSVPVEAKICNNLKFIELEQEKWIETIKNANFDFRESKITEATNKGFNIKVEAEKLSEYYKKLV